ncbi:MAG: HD domain-containing protein [Nanoarchaeota archaeon]|nr:HD domain-containing protein [Nanoarchaeota archaeon]
MVKKECNKEDWKYHIQLVRHYSLKLAKILNADLEIVEISALLHDIGRIKFGPENHEITGANESVKILEKLNYSTEKIDKVKHCVEAHRGDGSITPKTLEAEIVNNADAMAHFNTVPLLLHFFGKRMSFEENLETTYQKIERGWNKKLTLPQAKELVKEQYNAIKIVLESNRKLL